MFEAEDRDLHLSASRMFTGGPAWISKGADVGFGSMSCLPDQALCDAQAFAEELAEHAKQNPANPCRVVDTGKLDQLTAMVDAMRLGFVRVLSVGILTVNGPSSKLLARATERVGK